MASDNPAARLLALLTLGQGIPASTPIRDAWRILLEAEEDDSLFLRRLGWVVGLPAAIRHEAEQLDTISPGLLLGELHQVESALLISLEAQWQQFQRTIDGRAWLSLEVLADALSHVSSSAVADADQLSALRGSVEGLLQEVLNSSVELSLRTFLVRHLQHMANAIVEVRIRGNEALRDAVSRPWGPWFFGTTPRAGLLRERRNAHFGTGPSGSPAAWCRS